MRKLVYVGKDNFDTIVKTADYDEMLKWKTKGFIFKQVMEDIKEDKKPDTDRIKKVREKMGLDWVLFFLKKYWQINPVMLYYN